MPGLVAHPDFAVIGLVLPGKMPLQAALLLGQVSGMGQGHPGPDGDRFELGQGIAEHGGPTLIEAGLAGLHVPFPSTDLDAFDDVGQPLALFGQGQFTCLEMGLIEQITAQPSDRPGAIPKQLREVIEPPIAAAAVAQAITLFAMFGADGDNMLDFLDNRIAVVGMDVVEVAEGGRGHLFRHIAQDAAYIGGDIGHGPARLQRAGENEHRPGLEQIAFEATGVRRCIVALQRLVLPGQFGMADCKRMQLLPGLIRGQGRDLRRQIGDSLC